MMEIDMESNTFRMNLNRKIKRIERQIKSYKERQAKINPNDSRYYILEEEIEEKVNQLKECVYLVDAYQRMLKAELSEDESSEDES